MKFHPDYKHLEAATDADVMRPRFEEALGHAGGAPLALEQFGVPRVFPRTEGGFTIQYLMKVKRDGDRSWNRLILCGHLLGSSDPRPVWLGNSSAFLLEDVGLAVPVFPFDPVMRDLPELCAPGKAPPVLSECYRALGPNGGGCDVAGYRILGYRMERRCVMLHTLRGAGATENGRQVIVRILKPRKAKAASRTTAMLVASGFAIDSPDGITVPQLLALGETQGIQCLEFARGDALHDLMGSERLEIACQAAGRALRKLHDAPASGLPEYTVARELEQLRTWVLLGGKIFPEWAGLLEESYDAVASSPPEECTPAGRVFVHRDFYDKQVLYSKNRTTLLDFDNAAAGDPAQDYGNFTAHLILRSRQESVLASNILGGMRAFEESYGSDDSVLTGRAGWWQAAALLRLSVLYALRPRWRHLAPGLAEDTLTSVHNTQS